MSTPTAALTLTRESVKTHPSSRSKPWDMCREQGCRRPTCSGAKERDPARRWCSHHDPNARLIKKAELAEGRRRRPPPRELGSEGFFLPFLLLRPNVLRFRAAELRKAKLGWVDEAGRAVMALPEEEVLRTLTSCDYANNVSVVRAEDEGGVVYVVRNRKRRHVLAKYRRLEEAVGHAHGVFGRWERRGFRGDEGQNRACRASIYRDADQMSAATEQDYAKRVHT